MLYPLAMAGAKTYCQEFEIANNGVKHLKVLNHLIMNTNQPLLVRVCITDVLGVA